MENDKKAETNSALTNNFENDYENAEVIFAICKSEYENERNRTNTIDSKISIIAAIVMAAVALIISMINFDCLSKIILSNGKDVAAFLIKMSIAFGTFALFISSLIILLLSIITRKYMSIDSFTYLQVENLNEKKCYYQLMCANKYAECCKHNQEVNERRCKLYNISIILLLIGVVFLVAFLLLKSIL